MTDAELAGIRDGCPCTVEGIEPCRSSCSCANWAMSGGCDRCARYGSLEQRQRAAKQIIAALRQPSSDQVLVPKEVLLECRNRISRLWEKERGGAFTDLAIFLGRLDALLSAVEAEWRKT